MQIRSPGRVSPPQHCQTLLTRSLLQEAIDKRLKQKSLLMQEAASAAQKAQDSLASFSLDLGSLIGRDASKSPRYPEKYIKTLDSILQKVAMGQDAKSVRCVILTDDQILRTAVSTSRSALLVF